jgi:DNA polymerase III delta prime subunit
MSFFENSDISRVEKETDLRKEHTLWVEKYRPITLDNLVGNQSIKEKLEVYINSSNIPHLLLSGKPGIGKTTIAKLLVYNIDCDYLYINASDENSVDTVREKIKGFASTQGFRDLKILILDESDFLSINAQAALRNILESYSKNTRFILTCNYKDKIIDPIISRCQLLELHNPSKKDIAKHLINILKKESVTFDMENLKLIIDSYYPDIRLMINTLQLKSVDGNLKIDKNSIIESDFRLKIIEVLKNKNISKKESFLSIRQLLSDNNISDFTDIYKMLYDNINDYATGQIANIILILAEMEYKSVLCVDKEINFCSAIVQILDKIKG